MIGCYYTVANVILTLILYKTFGFRDPLGLRQEMRGVDTIPAAKTTSECLSVTSPKLNGDEAVCAECAHGTNGECASGNMYVNLLSYKALGCKTLKVLGLVSIHGERCFIRDGVNSIGYTSITLKGWRILRVRRPYSLPYGDKCND